jgi:putative ATPase
VVDLFEQHAERERREASGDVPLADRMRPQRLEEVEGQPGIVGPGSFLARALAADRLPSLILWGPPGSGKTTLARLTAAYTKARFVPFSAVLGGVKDVRAIIDEARRRRVENGVRTILFVDEIHRFNKAQQDAFLPHVEDGTVVLIGATTENPSFYVNSALLSRCRVVRLEPLPAEAVARVLRRTLDEPQRGLGPGAPAFDDEAVVRIAELADGDARRALNLLEQAAQHARTEGRQRLDRAAVDEALARPGLRHDRSGDQHYDVVSAFIKSLRGSDPDAALYWMLRMLEAGEEPLFVLRRLVIFAAEDIGNADPRALQVALAAMEAFRFLGLPEGRIPMAQACTYLAAAPKSNASYAALNAAAEEARAAGALPVPLHLRNAPTGLAKSLGHGAEYRYPHDWPGHFVPDATYLPDALRGRVYYEPSDQGLEQKIGERLRRLRAERAAALAAGRERREPAADGEGG